jgi:hypothetical protein
MINASTLMLVDPISKTEPSGPFFWNHTADLFLAVWNNVLVQRLVTAVKLSLEFGRELPFLGKFRPPKISFLGYILYFHYQFTDSNKRRGMRNGRTLAEIGSGF